MCRLGVVGLGLPGRVWRSNSFLCSTVSAEQGNHLCTNICPSHLPVHCLPPLSNPLLFSSEWHINLSYMTVAGFPYSYGASLGTKLSLFFLLLISLVSLIIRL